MKKLLSILALITFAYAPFATAQSTDRLERKVKAQAEAIADVSTAMGAQATATEQIGTNLFTVTQEVDELKAALKALANGGNDTFLIDGQSFVAIAGELKPLVSTAMEAVDDVKEHNPKTTMGYITAIGLVLLKMLGTGTLAAFLTELIKVVGKVKGWFTSSKKSTRIAAGVALILGTGYQIVKGGSFDFVAWGLTMSAIFTAAVGLYDIILWRVFKGKKEDTSAQA